MQRTLGILGTTGGMVLFLSACVSFFGRDNDQGGPKSARKEHVARKCERMGFDSTHASAPQQLDQAGLVKVKIYPARQSSKTKGSQLGSREGRIIARVVNEGTGAWPGMVLTGGSTSCWYVWEDRDGQMRSKFVALDGSTEAIDRYFDIELHPNDHMVDSSQWNPPSRTAMSDRSSPFQLATFTPAPQALVFNTGWTTCLINGCCRSRQ